jgi:RimJ/RimL family protein N-acetyltransferase
VEVRPARLEDVPAVVSVHIRSWQAAYRGLVPDSYLDGLDGQFDERRTRWESNLGTPAWGETLVAVLDGQVVGFISFGPDRHHKDGTSEVYALYCTPDVWGTGAGHVLMADALARLADEGYQEVTLWVLSDNERARRFYERAGFQADSDTAVFEVAGIELDETCYRQVLQHDD